MIRNGLLIRNSATTGGFISFILFVHNILLLGELFNLNHRDPINSVNYKIMRKSNMFIKIVLYIIILSYLPYI